jgi:large subunit ribosomal protein L29
MKISEIRAKSQDELNKTMRDLKKEAYNLRFQRVNGELQKTHRFKQIRTTIAKILTVLSDNKE